MAKFQKLPLENALDESPQISSLVGVYGEDAKYLREYMEVYHQLSSQLVATHNKLTSNYQSLARHLANFKPTRLIPESDSTNGDLSSSLKTFSDIVSEMSSWEHIYATQIADGMVYPLSKFIGSELQDIETLESLYLSSRDDVDRSVTRYSRCRRKDPQQERHEATEDVYNSRKSYHMMALQYYSRLNQLRSGRHMALLQPVLGLVTAARGHLQLGNEALNSTSKDDFLSEIGVKLKGMSDDLGKEKQDTAELITSIVTQCQLIYYPQPPAELSQMPPDTTLTSKSGYLNVHRKYMGVMSSWERQFVFIEGGNLMAMAKGEIAGTLILELDSSSLAHATDTDDRPHVFTVVTAKRSVILQALNDRERDEWMLTIERLAKEGGYVKSEKLTSSSSLFSGVSQFLADKLHVGSSTVNETTPPTTPSSPSPGTPSSRALRGGVIPNDAPIIFDLLSTTEESPAVNSTVSDSNDSTKCFSVRFLGCMVVNVDTVESFLVGQTVVFEVMRRILAARAIHDMFTTSHLHLCVNGSHLVLKDPSTTDVKLQHRLRDVAFWATHNDNHRLVGYIVCQQEGGKEGPFSCYVFESDEGGKEICSALGAAARQAYAHLLDQKTCQDKRKQETQLLLANIALLPDKDSPPEISPDGSHIVLDSKAGQFQSPKRKGKKTDSDA